VPVPSPPYNDFGTPISSGLALGDFNHGGHEGLAVGLLNNIAAAIFFGNGDGTFTGSSTLANTSGKNTISIKAANVNSNRNLDLFPSTSVSLLGYSHGAFNAVEQNLVIAGNSSFAGDFNGDGKLDLAVNSDVLQGAVNVFVLLGTGNGTFTQGVALNASGFVTAADFNGDGKLDIAVCDSSTNMVTILLGDGAGNFSASDSLGVG